MNMDQAARKVLNHLKEKVAASVDGAMYGDRSRALQDIDLLLYEPSTKGVKNLLAPTANLQELSIENGWGQEFISLASELENLLGIE